jgi:hypothetical protein
MANDPWQDPDNLSKMERSVFGSGTNAETAVETTRRLFEENSTDAALTIIHIAKHGSTDRARLDAAKYITERALGPVRDQAGTDDEDELTKMFRGITGISN